MDEVEETTSESQPQPQKLSMKVSFSVKTQQQTFNPEKHYASFKAKELETDEKEEIIALENGVAIERVRKTKQKFGPEYVIPIRKNQSTDDRLKRITTQQIEALRTLVLNGEADEADQARLELLEAAAGIKSKTVDGRDDNSEAIDHIEEKDEESLIEPDYEQIPIGAFGTAFLRGCGWTEDSGVGKTNKMVIPLKISEPRPKGLGLGASLDIMPSTDANGTVKGKEDREKERRDRNRKDRRYENNDDIQVLEEVKPLGKGSYIRCLGGLNKGSYGEVMSVDEETSSLFVKLAPSRMDRKGKMVRAHQLAVEVVSLKEYRRATRGD